MLLSPISLTELLHDPNVSILPMGLRLLPKPDWVVTGENRLSYTTLTRLVECCRELHWREDIERIGSYPELDSITKSISAEFFSPIYIENIFLIKYRIKEVRKRGYLIEFLISDESENKIYAKFSLILVFYSNLTNSAVEPHEVIMRHLKSLCLK